MKIMVSSNQVEIIEIDNFKQFHIEASGDTNSLQAQFTQHKVGSVQDAHHAAIAIDFIRAQAGELAQQTEWQTGFNNMLAYAKTKGWLTEDGQAVLAHIEWAAA